MKKNIWIWNHYATNMYKEQAGRHYWFAERLYKRGYCPTIFTASTIHNSDKHIDTNGNKFKLEEKSGISFVFIDTPRYLGNKIGRIKNMISFYKNLFPSAKHYSKINGKPDIILASSVHPLTLIAGIKIAKKFNVPCICEIRDLWPESIVAYGFLKKNSIILKFLYRAEKWIYKKANKIIMTWEGGKEYIINQGWSDDIDLSKITHISNGVVIDEFDKNSRCYHISDSDLENKSYKNIVYTGSIRKVNNLEILLETAKIIKKEGYKEIQFLIYGFGDEVETLKKRCKNEKIDNVIFKGQVEKKYIPFILENAYINILHNSSTSLNQYGQSQNKLYEYLAAGKPIVQTYTTKYSIFEKANCGISVTKQNAKEIAESLIKICNSNDVVEMGKNARKLSYEFDFDILTQKLINVIEKN